MIALATCERGAQASEVTDHLALLSDYFSAAARVVAGADAGVKRLKLNKLSGKDRSAALAEVDGLLDSLRSLGARQRIFAGDIDAYLQSVRSRGFSEHHAMWWNASI